MAKTPEQKAAEIALKDLQKKAKKLKIDFADLPVEELTVLVNAAEAAAAAQAEKNGEVTAPSAAPSVVSPRQDVNDAQDQANAAEAAKAPVVTPAGDTLISFVVTKTNKVRHNLVVTPDGKVQLKTVHGTVTGDFKSVDEGKRHLENLSRF